MEREPLRAFWTDTGQALQFRDKTDEGIRQ
jgi:hypothetical protein